MKICRFQYQDATHYGVIEGGTVTVLDAMPYNGIVKGEGKVALEKVKLLPPAFPPNVIAIGTNYMGHIQESNVTPPERPLIFLKATSSVIGPGDAIQLPRIAPDHVDYEAELAVVIGKRARHVSEEDALDYVFGYTCANDVSQRLCQKTLDRQWARGKSFDTFCPLGPWIETEIADPQTLGIRSRLNGETMQDSNTGRLIFDVRKLISYISDAMTLLPGTVILTGTPDGVGDARDPAVYLQAGDIIEIEIDGVGTLTNPVVAE
ncbi:MAG: fumarylacetoacetate hydrolase family protein [Victivallales bacterium]|jgi:2-keto-4-pentenoate hydratase/2-oxohepta-3-ene-1,7-dioic acid hydratase in catechol pathway|nr:fumarylacetoacetate hydrolase family protein [Victivallales bacterium]MBT7163517.1 fumarylacetoacetate hydrolase family protein [Victivallales bacterium]MBT7303338.1 fumarylacetoacetate hydrolase family protein [Victivallales bacterium]